MLKLVSDSTDYCLSYWIINYFKLTKGQTSTFFLFGKFKALIYIFEQKNLPDGAYH